jgi:hypothetical protein
MAEYDRIMPSINNMWQNKLYLNAFVSFLYVSLFVQRQFLEDINKTKLIAINFESYVF